MPTWQQWWDKSERSLKTARICLDAGDLLGAANRLWYAIYQGVHAVLIHKGMTPRAGLEDWHHRQIVDQYGLVVCHTVRTKAGKNSLLQARSLISIALDWRLDADYGDHAQLDKEKLRRAIAKFDRVLKYCQEEALR